jgi:uncharacterized membrane protein
MTDTTGSMPRTEESFRGTAIIAYVLFLIGFPSLHLTTVVGLVVAYVQRRDARGTVWESHFTNLIETFWISLLLGLVAIPLIFAFGLGIVLGVGVLVFFLYRTIKGLIRAVDGRPYA